MAKKKPTRMDRKKELVSLLVTAMSETKENPDIVFQQGIGDDQREMVNLTMLANRVDIIPKYDGFGMLIEPKREAIPALLKSQLTAGVKALLELAEAVKDVETRKRFHDTALAGRTFVNSLGIPRAAKKTETLERHAADFTGILDGFNL